MQSVSEQNGRFSVLRSVLSACCGYLFCGILLLIGAGAIYRGFISEHWVNLICWSSTVISALLTAFFAAGKGGRRIVGSLCGGVLLYLLFLLTGEIAGGVFDGTHGLIMAIVVLVDCVIGAVISGLIRR